MKSALNKHQKINSKITLKYASENSEMHQKTALNKAEYKHQKIDSEISFE